MPLDGGERQTFRSSAGATATVGRARLEVIDLAAILLTTYPTAKAATCPSSLI
jgi:hypothetical protein